MKTNNYIIITGGGTGGHLSVASQFAKEINNQSKNTKIIFIGSKNGQDKKWFEGNKTISKSYFLNTKGIVKQTPIKTIYSIALMLFSIVYCMYILKKYNVQKVICVGGYSSAGASIACVLLKKSLFIHEQNSAYGSLNKLLAKYAKMFFCSFNIDKNLNETLRQQIKISKIKSYPTRDVFFENQKIKNKTIKTIMFMGGSLGAKDINDFALKIADKLNILNIKIIHQCGRDDIARVKDFYTKNNIDADCFDYCDDIISKMSNADFAISRAGASSLWEFCALNTPCLFVPYPYAYKNHQYFNAKFLYDKGLCLLKTKEQIVGNELAILDEILSVNIAKISKQLNSTIKPNGARDIIKQILSA